MHALTILAHGDLSQLAVLDVPTPELRGPTHVRVRVAAAALNHLDLFLIAGLPGVKITPPWIVGADAVGIVDQIGDQVTAVKVGARVIINPGISCRECAYCLAGEQPLCPRYAILGEHLPGTMAEYVVVPEENLHVVPTGISDAVAAGFTLATLTAWRMVVTRAQVRPNEDVLIWGIGGGVALAAMQICAAIGARVWAVSGDDIKLARARGLGAFETINHRTTDVGKFVRERTGKRGVNVVIDNVGTDTWKSSLGSLGRAGRLVTCGGTSGPMVETDVRRLFWNQWTILGSTMGNDAEFHAIGDALVAKKLTTVVDKIFPLREGRQAFERLAAGGQFGKVIVSIP